MRRIRPARTLLSWLLLLTLVIVPVSEAFSCALEADRHDWVGGDALHDAADMDDHDGGGGKGDGDCVHGHCHHTVGSLQPLAAWTDAQDRHARLRWPPPDTLTSQPQERLQRPPRA